jgi:hypothetical protein
MSDKEEFLRGVYIEPMSMNETVKKKHEKAVDRKG